jgi:hypothetical protein
MRVGIESAYQQIDVYNYFFFGVLPPSPFDGSVSALALRSASSMTARRFHSALFAARFAIHGMGISRRPVFDNGKRRMPPGDEERLLLLRISTGFV